MIIPLFLKPKVERFRCLYLLSSGITGKSQFLFQKLGKLQDDYFLDKRIKPSGRMRYGLPMRIQTRTNREGIRSDRAAVERGNLQGIWRSRGRQPHPLKAPGAPLPATGNVCRHFRIKMLRGAYELMPEHVLGIRDALWKELKQQRVSGP